jgi:hypothetical protein
MPTEPVILNDADSSFSASKRAKYHPASLDGPSIQRDTDLTKAWNDDGAREPASLSCASTHIGFQRITLVTSTRTNLSGPLTLPSAPSAPSCADVRSKSL